MAYSWIIDLFVLKKGDLTKRPNRFHSSAVKLVSSLINLVFSIVFLLFSIVSFSQTKEINKKIDYLVDNKFSSLDIIDSVLRKNRKDKHIFDLV